MERAEELAALDGALRAACAGVGATVLVEGPPGIGKTRLLTAAVARARHAGMQVLQARAGELETSLPYAVVRQLFEPALDAAGDARREVLLTGAAGQARPIVDRRADPAGAADAAAVLHGLYWLAADLAADRPLAIVVDDLHWSDPASAGWLAYLARRVEGLAIALILGARPVEPGADETLLAPLRSGDGLTRVEPGPLSLEAVDGLARAALGEQVEEPFSAACRAATGGNPFYVAEILRALALDGVPGTAASIEAIDGLTPRAVVDATLARLRRMPGEALAVAEAVALLEPVAELRWVGELTDLDADVVAGAADALLGLGMLRSVAPCRFEHPILRSAVESEIAPARRGRLHLKAAAAFAAAELPIETVAAHLMLAPTTGEPWVVALLRRAAARGERARRSAGRGDLPRARAGRAPAAGAAPRAAARPRRRREPGPRERARRSTCARRSRSRGRPTMSPPWRSCSATCSSSPARSTRRSTSSATSCSGCPAATAARCSSCRRSCCASRARPGGCPRRRRSPPRSRRARRVARRSRARCRRASRCATS